MSCGFPIETMTVSQTLRNQHYATNAVDWFYNDFALYRYENFTKSVKHSLSLSRSLPLSVNEFPALIADGLFLLNVLFSLGIKISFNN